MELWQIGFRFGKRRKGNSFYFGKETKRSTHAKKLEKIEIVDKKNCSY